MYSLSATEKAVIGGVRTILVAAFSADALYTYATPERHTITAVAGITGGWAVYELPDTAQASAPGKPSKGGWVCSHRLDLSAPGLSTARAYVAEQLQAGPVLVLVQDLSGQWWLLGQAFGLLLSGTSWATGAYKGDSGQGFQLERTEPAAPRRVAQSFVNLIYNASTPVEAAPTV